MPITFTPADRKAISRRVIKIPLENEAFVQAEANALKASNDFLAVDNGNKEYYDFYQGIVSAYEVEQRDISGVNAGEFTETDIHNSAIQAPGNLFFPTTPPAAINIYFNPKIIPEVNGGNSTTGFYPCETLLFNNPASAVSPSGNGISEIETILQTGFSDGAGTTTLSAIYNIGDLTVSLAAPIGAVAGDRIYVRNLTNSFIAVVVGGAGLSLNIYPLTNPSANMAGGSNVGLIFNGFTQPERQTLVAATAANQDILNGLTISGTNSLTNLVSLWVALLNEQKNNFTNVLLLDDVRPPETVQNNTALTNVNATLTNIAIWQALPNIGVGGKFDNTPLTNLLGYTTTRQALFAARLTQITSSLGGVVDNGNGTFTFLLTNLDPYFKRYQFLNIRINRAYGSLTRSVKLLNSNNILQTLIDNNNFLLNAYTSIPSTSPSSEFILATPFAKDSDGTQNILVKDITGFNSGDNVYIISETQPEISLILRNVSQNVSVNPPINTFILSADVPKGYLKKDLARIYKI